jgi:hypothetical protein
MTDKQKIKQAAVVWSALGLIASMILISINRIL